MIAVLLSALLSQEPPPRPPQPRVERPPREQEAIERLRRELESMPPGSPERERKQAELRRLELPQPRPPHPPPRPPAPEDDGVFRKDAEEMPPEPRRGPGRPEVPARVLEEVKAWLRENEPETLRRVEKAGEDGRRQEMTAMLLDAQSRMRELTDLKSRDPKAFEKTQELRRLERETQEVAELARTGPPAEREAAGKKLRAALDRLFDLREEQKGRELEELKRRVSEIEKQLEARKASKERIVERRRRELLGERLQDDW